MPQAGLLIFLSFLIKEKHQIRGILPVMLKQAPEHIDLVLRRGSSVDIEVVCYHRGRVCAAPGMRKLTCQIHARNTPSSESAK